MNFFENLDGTNRPLRDVQRIALKWLQDNWHKSRVFALNLPTGSGKSMIARTIQSECGGVIIPPSNVLLQQYVEEYPHVNALMGSAHYECPESITCYDHVHTFEKKPCEGCPYMVARNKALEGVPTIFNPASLYHCNNKETRGNVTIIDEAHILGQFMCSMTGHSFDQEKYPFTSQCCNEIYLVEWIDKQVQKLKKLFKAYKNGGKLKEAKECKKEIDTLDLIKQGFIENSENYAVWIDDKEVKGKRRTKLNIRPVSPPKFIRDIILGSGKVILMSGTLFSSDIKDLIGNEPYLHLDLPSPIPANRRPIYYRPINQRINKDTDPKILAQAITEIVNKHPGENTICHLSYAVSATVSNALDIPVLNNKKEDKDRILEEFKNKGGVFIAAGCAEGIDLKGDLCRVNIVPKMLFPNLGDPVVIKRKAHIDGEQWYALQTLKTTIQQLGRSTRSESDYSIGYVLDPQFAKLVLKYKHILPKSFLEAIKWT